MKRFISLDPDLHDWLIREHTYQLDSERNRLRFAARSAVEQIQTNIAAQERILEALNACE
jgi:hypothetical protein